MSSNFPAFPKLPPELRSMVWMYALPEPRVFEVLDTPQSNLKTPAQDGLTFANSCHEPPPSLATVCRESRAFVLRTYKPLTLSHTIKYIDPSRDIILLEPYLLIRRLLRALHFLAQISQMRDNISQVALGTSYGFSTGIFHPIISGKVSRNNIKMLLAKLSKFPRLKNVLFIIHEEFQFAGPKLALPHGLQLFHHNYSRKYEGESGVSRHNRSPSESTTSTPTTQAPESPGVSHHTDGHDVLEKQSPDRANKDSMALVRPSNTGQYANLEFVLGSVFTWSQAKLDSHHVISDPMSKYLANPNHPPIQDSRTMYRTFELVFDLWFHGKGDLAGMAARRGFYVLEYVLTDDHPDLVWHFLDTIYDMVDRGHLQLLSMFLDHATVLAQHQLPAQHPLVRILQQLRKCDFQTDQGRKFVCHLLRLAWLRNVDLLAEHIPTSGAQRLWLYEQLIWDGRTRLRKGSDLAKRREAMNRALEAMAESEKVAAAEDESDQLRIEALMLEFTQMDLGDKVKAEQLAINLLSRTSSSESSRSSDRFHAYARKMLARVHQDRQEWDTAEENLRCAVSKREAAHGTNNNLRHMSCGCPVFWTRTRPTSTRVQLPSHSAATMTLTLLPCLWISDELGYRSFLDPITRFHTPFAYLRQSVASLSIYSYFKLAESP
ncbi:hypothetical protein AUP68_12468 [Ilyonectria robusta]